jgi:hypothetical protein
MKKKKRSGKKEKWKRRKGPNAFTSRRELMNYFIVDEGDLLRIDSFRLIFLTKKGTI